MNQGWTPAHCAAENNHKDVLQLLYQYSADVLMCDENGDTPKRIAQLYGHLECVEYLESIESSPPPQQTFETSSKSKKRKKLRQQMNDLDEKEEKLDGNHDAIRH